MEQHQPALRRLPGLMKSKKEERKLFLHCSPSASYIKFNYNAK
jgi:hypothetical protein